MPILQSRLLRLIQAAETYLRRDKRLRQQITTQCINATTLESLKHGILSELAAIPELDAAELVIAEERWRYDANATRNIKDRARMRRRRAGIPPLETPQPGVKTVRKTQPDEPYTGIAPPPHVAASLAEDDEMQAIMDEFAQESTTPEEEAFLKELRERHRREDEETKKESEE